MSFVLGCSDNSLTPEIIYTGNSLVDASTRGSGGSNGGSPAHRPDANDSSSGGKDVDASQPETGGRGNGGSPVIRDAEGPPSDGGTSASGGRTGTGYSGGAGGSSSSTGGVHGGAAGRSGSAGTGGSDGGGEDASVPAHGGSSGSQNGNTGGHNSGGGTTGGSTGGAHTGGRSAGGANTGGRATGGASASKGGANTGGRATGGANTGGRASGGTTAGGAAGDGGGGATCKPLSVNLLTAALKDPVYATAPSGDSRIFVLERLEGRIRIVDSAGLRAAPFLDLSSKISKEGYEVGLLSLVFHPNFVTNRTFYVSYTTPAGKLRVSRFRVPAATPDVADPASESVTIEVTKASHHNTGGMLLFGPDGLFYVAIGDDDSEANGQDLSVLNGKILRLAVDPALDGCTVPSTNPFIGVPQVKPEIWAYGLREPYRFWFDDGELYIGDVGDNQREEVNVVPAATGGRNYGWPVMEGTRCHTPATGCNQSGLVLPVYEFAHDGGTAVIGGYVYRGSALSSCYRGRYFFGSYSAGWVRTFDLGSSPLDVRDEPGALVPGFVSFGRDGQGEILILGYDQTLHRIVSP